jgi:hypothetical protein
MPAIHHNELIQVDDEDLTEGVFVIPSGVQTVALRAFSACNTLSMIRLNDLIDEFAVRDWLFHATASVQVMSVLQSDAQMELRLLQVRTPEFSWSFGGSAAHARDASFGKVQLSRRDV